ncbi:MAG: tetratricopeptide repeat protein [Anaerolineae bacterium]|nr:tetratricopeptide repeat protein [Anaerolineae bacterium]
MKVLCRKTLRVGLLVASSILAILLPLTAAAKVPLAVSLVQIDPAAQCAEGVQRFQIGQAVEALPLLESGFAGRAEATFIQPNELGSCALTLGLLRYNTGDRDGALEAYKIALNIFRDINDRAGQGVTLNNIGAVYHAQGRYEEALDVLYQALDIRRTIADLAGEGETLANIGAIYLAQGRHKEALDILQQALAILRDVGYRAHEGRTLNNIGSVYYAQGRYKEALDAYQQALAIQREVGDRAGEGVTLNGVGLIYNDQGHYEEALDAYHQALEIQHAGEDRAGEGLTLNNIGLIYHNQGQYEKALDIYQQALEIQREVGDRAGEGTTLNNIAAIYRAQGQYEEAQETYRQALAIRRDVGDRSGEGMTLNNIGAVYHVQGRYGEALDTFQQALAIAREVNNRAGEANILTNIGLIYDAQGRYKEALDIYQQTLVTQHDLGHRGSEAATLINIGAAYDAQGKYQEALDIFQQSLVLQRELGNRTGEGRVLISIGEIYHLQGWYEEALDTYQQALALAREVGDRAGEATILTDKGGIYHSQGRYGEALNTYQQALAIQQAIGDRVGEGVTLSNIGFAYLQQGQSDQALAHYEQAMTVIESVRAVAGNEAGRTGFITQFADIYTRAVALYHQQGQDAVAFFSTERGRARAFLDSLATGQIQLSDNAAADLLIQEQEAYARRQAAQDALAKARALNPSNAQLEANLEAQLAVAEEIYTTALAAIEVRGGQLAALVPGRSTVLDLPAIQALLDDQTTLVSYYVLDDEGTLAFIITNNNFSVRELPQATADNLRQELKRLNDWPDLEISYRLPLQNLYTWLVEPLVNQINTPLVGIIPHQQLHYLPFAALMDNETFFGEKYLLFTLPSANALPFIQANATIAHRTHRPGAVVFGNPATDEPGLSILTNAASEAKAIGNLLAVPAYTEAEASEARLWAEAGQARVLHLAAHGVYNPTDSLLSTIYLAPGGEDNGRLEVSEVYDLPLKGTELVVLSACETNMGQLSVGDDIVGLTRALIFAGAPTVITSLWNVDSAATEMLMVSFYHHWQEGLSKVEALQAAQAEVRAADPRWRSPYYWAGFILSGDSGEVTGDTVVSNATPDASTATSDSGLVYYVWLNITHLKLSAITQRGVWIILSLVFMVSLYVFLARSKEQIVVIEKDERRYATVMRKPLFPMSIRILALIFAIFVSFFAIIFWFWQ